MPAKICPLYKAAAIAGLPLVVKDEPRVSLPEAIDLGVKTGVLSCDGEACAWYAGPGCSVFQIPGNIAGVATEIHEK